MVKYYKKRDSLKRTAGNIKSLLATSISSSFPGVKYRTRAYDGKIAVPLEVVKAENVNVQQIYESAKKLLDVHKTGHDINTVTYPSIYQTASLPFTTYKNACSKLADAEKLSKARSFQRSVMSTNLQINGLDSETINEYIIVIVAKRKRTEELVNYYQKKDEFYKERSILTDTQMQDIIGIVPPVQPTEDKIHQVKAIAQYTTTNTDLMKKQLTGDYNIQSKLWAARMQETQYKQELKGNNMGTFSDQLANRLLTQQVYTNAITEISNQIQTVAEVQLTIKDSAKFGNLNDSDEIVIYLLLKSAIVGDNPATKLNFVLQQKVLSVKQNLAQYTGMFKYGNFKQSAQLIYLQDGIAFKPIYFPKSGQKLIVKSQFLPISSYLLKPQNRAKLISAAINKTIQFNTDYTKLISYMTPILPAIRKDSYVFKFHTLQFIYKRIEDAMKTVMRNNDADVVSQVYHQEEYIQFVLMLYGPPVKKNMDPDNVNRATYKGLGKLVGQYQIKQYQKILQGVFKLAKIPLKTNCSITKQDGIQFNSAQNNSFAQPLKQIGDALCCMCIVQEIASFAAFNVKVTDTTQQKNFVNLTEFSKTYQTFMQTLIQMKIDFEQQNELKATNILNTLSVSTSIQTIATNMVQILASKFTENPDNANIRYQILTMFGFELDPSYNLSLDLSNTRKVDLRMAATQYLLAKEEQNDIIRELCNQITLDNTVSGQALATMMMTAAGEPTLKSGLISFLKIMLYMEIANELFENFFTLFYMFSSRRFRGINDVEMKYLVYQVANLTIELLNVMENENPDILISKDVKLNDQKVRLPCPFDVIRNAIITIKNTSLKQVYIKTSDQYKDQYFKTKLIPETVMRDIAGMQANQMAKSLTKQPFLKFKIYRQNDAASFAQQPNTYFFDTNQTPAKFKTQVEKYNQDVKAMQLQMANNNVNLNQTTNNNNQMFNQLNNDASMMDFTSILNTTSNNGNPNIQVDRGVSFLNDRSFV